MATQFKLARVLKIWFDICLAAGLLGCVVLVAWLFLSPMIIGGTGQKADGAIWVGIGEGVIRPVLAVETDLESEDEISSLRLVKGTAELRFLTSSWTIHMISNSGLILLLLVAVAIIQLIRLLLSDVLAGTPFTLANGRRLRWIGWLTVSSGLVFPILNFLVARWMLAQLPAQEPPLSATLQFGDDWILAGLFILLLSAIFRHGAELEEERSLTV